MSTPDLLRRYLAHVFPDSLITAEPTADMAGWHIGVVSPRFRGLDFSQMQALVLEALEVFFDCDPPELPPIHWQLRYPKAPCAR